MCSPAPGLTPALPASSPRRGPGPLTHKEPGFSKDRLRQEPSSVQRTTENRTDVAPSPAPRWANGLGVPGAPRSGASLPPSGGHRKARARHGPAADSRAQAPTLHEPMAGSGAGGRPVASREPRTALRASSCPPGSRHLVFVGPWPWCQQEWGWGSYTKDATAKPPSSRTSSFLPASGRPGAVRGA